MKQRANFQDHKRPTDPSAPLQRLMTAIGTGTREALWAVQLIERKAAVARWREGPLTHIRPPLRSSQRRRR